MNEEHRSYLSKAGGWLHSQKGVRLLLLLGGIGVALILLSEWIPFGAKTSTGDTAFTAAEYATYLERRLEELVSSIEGAGDCRVMVTLENGVEYIYATEDKSDNNFRQDGSAVDTRENVTQSVIVVDDRGLLVTEILPTVQGVVVVCKGGGNETVKAQVASAVSTVLNISEKRVCVLQQS